MDRRNPKNNRHENKNAIKNFKQVRIPGHGCREIGKNPFGFPAPVLENGAVRM